MLFAEILISVSLEGKHRNCGLVWTGRKWGGDPASVLSPVAGSLAGGSRGVLTSSRVSCVCSCLKLPLQGTSCGVLGVGVGGGSKALGEEPPAQGHLGSKRENAEWVSGTPFCA